MFYLNVNVLHIFLLIFLDHCKHAVAFLFWLHRRSEEPSVTATTCYWKKSALSKVGPGTKFDVASLLNIEKEQPTLTSECIFRDTLVESCTDADGGVFDICNCKPNYFQTMSLHLLNLDFASNIELGKGPAEFISFIRGTF